MSQSIPEMMLRGAGRGGRDRRRPARAAAPSHATGDRAGALGRPAVLRASRSGTSTGSPRRPTCCRSPRARRSSRRGSSARRCSSSLSGEAQGHAGERAGWARCARATSSASCRALDGGPRTRVRRGRDPDRRAPAVPAHAPEAARGRAAAHPQAPGFARPPGPQPARRPRSTPSRSAVLRSRRASPRPARRRPPRRSSRVCSAFRLPAIAAVTPGWATFHASASCAIVMSEALGDRAEPVDDRRGRGRACRR